MQALFYDPITDCLYIENAIYKIEDAIYKDKPVTLKVRWEEIEKRRSDETEKIESLHKTKKEP